MIFWPSQQGIYFSKFYPHILFWWLMTLVDTIRGGGDMVELPAATSLLHLFLHLKHRY